MIQPLRGAIFELAPVEFRQRAFSRSRTSTSGIDEQTSSNTRVISKNKQMYRKIKDILIKPVSVHATSPKHRRSTHSLKS